MLRAEPVALRPQARCRGARLSDVGLAADGEVELAGELRLEGREARRHRGAPRARRGRRFRGPRLARLQRFLEVLELGLERLVLGEERLGLLAAVVRLQDDVGHGVLQGAALALELGEHARPGERLGLEAPVLLEQALAVGDGQLAPRVAAGTGRDARGRLRERLRRVGGGGEELVARRGRWGRRCLRRRHRWRCLCRRRRQFLHGSEVL